MDSSVDFPAPSWYPKALASGLKLTHSLTHSYTNGWLSVLAKDTTADLDGVGFKPPI